MIRQMENLLQWEPLVVTIGFLLAGWLVYKILLRGVSKERHTSLKSHFTNTFIHLAIASALLAAFHALGKIYHSDESIVSISRIYSYLGIITLIQGAVAFIKTARLVILESLFLGHMREGVPILLVNLVSLGLSILLFGWIVTEVFNFKIGPLLATSAVFSLILGLALQETLGNLFAGVALQFDKPYELGDWIEVFSNNQKWAGQVHEITWRATILTGFADEVITIPNRIMGQSEITNFQAKERPFYRSQFFKLPHGTSIEKAKALLEQAARESEYTCEDPPPKALLSESSESWLYFRLIYTLRDYGRQLLAADQVISRATVLLEQAGIPIASQRIELHQK